MKDIYFIAEIGVNHEAKLKVLETYFRCQKRWCSSCKTSSYKAEKIVSKLLNLTGINPLKKKSQLKLYRKLDGFDYSDYKKFITTVKKLK